jgi:hypothetical protein
MPLLYVDVMVAEIGANACDADQHVNKAAVREIIAGCRALASDLLEMHEATGISLDNWDNARAFVSAFMNGRDIPRNNA